MGNPQTINQTTPNQVSFGETKISRSGVFAFHVLLLLTILSDSFCTLWTIIFTGVVLFYAIMPIICYRTYIGYKLARLFYMFGSVLLFINLVIQGKPSFAFDGDLPLFENIPLQIAILSTILFSYFYSGSRFQLETTSFFTSLLTGCYFILIPYRPWETGPDRWVITFLAIAVLQTARILSYPSWLIGKLQQLPLNQRKSYYAYFLNGIIDYSFYLKTPKSLLSLADALWIGHPYQQDKMLNSILKKASERYKGNLITEFRKQLIASTDIPERLKIFEFLRLLKELSVEELINYTQECLKKYADYLPALERLCIDLNKEFSKVLTGDKSYTNNLALVLEILLYSTFIQEDIKASLKSNSHFLAAFANLETPNGNYLHKELLISPPPFHEYEDYEALENFEKRKNLVRDILHEKQIDINGSEVNVWLIKPGDSHKEDLIQAFMHDSLSVTIKEQHAMLLQMMGSNIGQNQPSKVIICGHSISPVCRRVTSIINQAIADIKTDNNIFTSGFAFLNSPPATAGEDIPLASLEESVRELKETTALISIQTVDESEYNGIVENIHSNIENIAMDQVKCIDMITDHTDAELPVSLPLHRIVDKKPVPVEIQAPRSLITSESYEALLSLFLNATFQDMENDLRRRLDTIEDWKRERKNEIKFKRDMLEQGIHKDLPENAQQDPEGFISGLKPKSISKYGSSGY